MKVICNLSGVEYELFTHWHDQKDPEHSPKQAHSFKHLTIAGQHPIFSLSTSDLLAELASWSARKLTRKDARVLFCALLHRTGLVEFRSTPSPTDQCIANHMLGLSRVVAWRDAIGHNLLHLPHYALNRETRSLSFIAQWIENWNDIYTSWKSNRERSKTILLADSRADLLDKLIRSSSKTSENYAGTLALWAFDASGLPNRTESDRIIRERWMKLFRLRGIQVFSANTVDIEDMLEYMEHNLEHGNIRAAKVLEHCRKLLHYNTRGLEAALGFIDGNTYAIVDSLDVEAHNRKVIAASAPLEEPLESMIPAIYPNKVSYLRARAAWRIGQSQKEVQVNAIFQLEKKLESATIEMLENEENKQDDLEEISASFKEEYSGMSETIKLEEI